MSESTAIRPLPQPISQEALQGTMMAITLVTFIPAILALAMAPAMLALNGHVVPDFVVFLLQAALVPVSAFAIYTMATLGKPFARVSSTFAAQQEWQQDPRRVPPPCQQHYADLLVASDELVTLRLLSEESLSTVERMRSEAHVLIDEISALTLTTDYTDWVAEQAPALRLREISYATVNFLNLARDVERAQRLSAAETPHLTPTAHIDRVQEELSAQPGPAYEIGQSSDRS